MRHGPGSRGTGALMGGGPHAFRALVCTAGQERAWWVPGLCLVGGGGGGS